MNTSNFGKVKSILKVFLEKSLLGGLTLILIVFTHLHSELSIHEVSPSKWDSLLITKDWTLKSDHHSIF
jgi:hypothetical protein